MLGGSLSPIVPRPYVPASDGVTRSRRRTGTHGWSCFDGQRAIAGSISRGLWAAERDVRDTARRADHFYVKALL
jgi:hypothetical protein